MAVVHWQMKSARAVIHSLRDHAHEEAQRENRLNRILSLVCINEMMD